MSSILTALISEASSPKVAAKASAKSYLLTREAPEAWYVPVRLLSVSSRAISATLELREGETNWSVTIFADWPAVSFSMSQTAKLSFSAAGFEP